MTILFEKNFFNNFGRRFFDVLILRKTLKGRSKMSVTEREFYTQQK